MKRLLLLPILLVSCHATGHICAVIDVAHKTCQYVMVEYVDDEGQVQRQRVPVSAVRDAAMQAQRDEVR